MNRGFFITGTDTNVGKTHVSGELMSVIANEGICVAGMKPVASGGVWASGQWRNEDALMLEARASIRLPYDWVNPYVFTSPIAPHLAARQEGRSICLETILARFGQITSLVECVVVEGAGGWLSPLDQGFDVADLAGSLRLPVILVVGIRLGCINHARLTDAAIRAAELPYAGWVANFIDPEFSTRSETVKTLIDCLGQEPLGIVSFQSDAQRIDQGQNNHWNHGEILRRMLP